MLRPEFRDSDPRTAANVYDGKIRGQISIQLIAFLTSVKLDNLSSEQVVSLRNRMSR